jgi:hypothetical protein
MVPKSGLHRILPVLIAALFVSTPSMAFVPPTINIAPPFAMGNLQRELLERRLEQRAPSQQAEPDAQTVFTGSLSFVPDRARTQANLRSFVARTPDPAARASLQQLLSNQPTILEDVSNALQPYGINPHNVADAYAVWWINAWSASQKINREPDQATVEAVKQQVYAAFTATPDFANASDAGKQEFAEALILQGFLLSAAFEQNKSNPAMLDQLAEAARQGAKAQGLDLTTMTLTRNGFVPRKGADASDAMEGEDPVRNARADAPGAEGESSGLGMALAAGAGLGATLLGGLALMRRG